MTNPNQSEQIQYHPPEVFQGDKALGKLSTLLNEADEKLRVNGEDISFRAVRSVINTVDDFYDTYRYNHGSDLFLRFQLDEEGNLVFKEEAHNEQGEEILEDLSEEEAEEVHALFSVVTTPNHILVFGGEASLSEDKLREISSFIEERDREVSRRLSVPIAKKSVFIDLEGNMEDTFANNLQRFLQISIEAGDLSSEDIPLPFKDNATWALAEFYLGDYKNILNPRGNINPNWFAIEQNVDRVERRVFTLPLPADMEDRFKATNEKALRMSIDSMFPDYELLSAAMGIKLSSPDGSGKSIFLRFKESGFDYRKVPEIADYKRYADWMGAYKGGFLDLIEAGFSDESKDPNDIDLKKTLIEVEPAELNDAYLKILDESMEHKHRSETSRHELQKRISGFMWHLYDYYAVTYFDLAKAISTMNKGEYDIGNFCQSLNVDYEDAIKTWTERK